MLLLKFPAIMQVAYDETSDDLLGEFSHMTLAEGCFWLSVTNLVTIGYGSIVSFATAALAYLFCADHACACLISIRERPSAVGLSSVYM